MVYDSNMIFMVMTQSEKEEFFIFKKEVEELGFFWRVDMITLYGIHVHICM